MRTDLLAVKGRRAELRKQKSDLDLEGAGLVTLIRSQLDPYEDDLTRLPIDQAEASMDRLLTVWSKLKEVKAKLHQIAGDLGDG